MESEKGLRGRKRGEMERPNRYGQEATTNRIKEV